MIIYKIKNNNSICNKIITFNQIILQNKIKKILKYKKEQIKMKMFIKIIKIRNKELDIKIFWKKATIVINNLKKYYNS